MSGEWYDVLADYNGRKMIALSESGTLPNAEAMDAYGIEWSYFSLWKDGFLDDFTASEVQELLSHEDIITLGELPPLPWSNAAPIAGDFNRDGSVDVADYIVWRKSMDQIATNLAADGDLNGRVDSGDHAIWRSQFGRAAGGGSVAFSAPEPSSVALMIGLFWGKLLLSPRRKVGAMNCVCALAPLREPKTRCKFQGDSQARFSLSTSCKTSSQLCARGPGNDSLVELLKTIVFWPSARRRSMFAGESSI
jgi:hypothetical protein